MIPSCVNHDSYICRLTSGERPKTFTPTMSSELTTSGSIVTWSIPSLPEYKKELLCYGYIREHCSQSIPIDIILLFQQHFCWQSICMEDIKSLLPSVHQPICSPVFECCHGLKWYLELWPSGYHDRSPFVQLYLCLLSQTELIINAEYTLSLLEAKINFRDKYRFERSSASEGTSRWYVNWKNKTKRLEHLQNLESLTFQCEMHSLQFHSENGLEPIENALEPLENGGMFTNPTASTVTSIADSYTWFIDDPATIKQMSSAPNVHGFNSPIFEMHGFKWYITVSPNGSMVERDGKVTVSLTLASLPRADMKILVKQKLYFGEKVVECLVTFDAGSNSYRGAPFGNEYTTEEMKAMKYLRFTAEVEVIEITQSTEIGITEDTIEITNDDVSDKPSYIINDLGDNHQKLEKYEWTIDEEIDYWASGRGHWDFLEMDLWTKSFTFHGLSWSLEMDRDGKIALILNRKHLKGWELEINHTLCIRFTVSLLELGTRFPSSAYFDGTKVSKDWGEHRVDVDELLKLWELTIQLQMEMIDIHPL